MSVESGQEPTQPDLQGQAPANGLPPGQAPEPAPPEGNGQAPASSTETPEERAQRANREAKNLRDRLHAETARAETLQQQLTDAARAEMSEVERYKAERDEAMMQRDQARRESMVHTIASNNGIPADAIDLLQGNTREELEASAAKLKRLIGERGPAPAPDFGGGARPGTGPSEESDFNSILRRAAGRPA